MGFLEGFIRTAVEIDHAEHRFRVELELTSLGRNLTLYRDGEVVEKASTPARFMVAGGGVIEVDASEYGFRRAVLRHDGSVRKLRPAPGTWEAARLRWAGRHPALSRFVAVSATIVVLVSIVVGVMELLEIATSIPGVRDLLAGWAFTSPIDLPPMLLVILGLVGGAAALEKALRIR